MCEKQQELDKKYEELSNREDKFLEKVEGYFKNLNQINNW